MWTRLISLLGNYCLLFNELYIEKEMVIVTKVSRGKETYYKLTPRKLCDSTVMVELALHNKSACTNLVRYMPTHIQIISLGTLACLQIVQGYIT